MNRRTFLNGLGIVTLAGAIGLERALARPLPGVDRRWSGAISQDTYVPCSPLEQFAEFMEATGQHLRPQSFDELLNDAARRSYLLPKLLQ